MYTPAQVAELADVAKTRGLRVHIDGARIANAIAGIGCSPAEITWRAGVDIISLGGNKNGTLSTDAIVSFDDGASAELVYRVKRAGHVASKMRYQSAQLSAYLSDGLWLRLARSANEAMARLAAGLATLGVETINEPEVNMLFVRVSDAVADALTDTGLLFYRMGPGVARFVTSFETTSAEVDAVVAAVAKAIG